ncbi:hypothetical protein CVS40_11050 [Lucilia cuprina]|nr:hypothetical protein CVS40_11050 [Lucilia cuprina]
MNIGYGPPSTLLVGWLVGWFTWQPTARKLLNLKEQVKLVDIAKRFGYVLSTFLWPKTCSKIILYKTPYVNIIANISNIGKEQEKETEMEEIKKSKVALNHKECNNFLFLNAKNVKALKVNSEFFYHQRELGISFKNIQIFNNLRELTYYRLILDDEQMRVLSRKCKKIKKLHLIECYNEYLTPLVPGEHLNLEYIYEMKKLEELVLYAEPDAEAVIKSYHLQDMFVNLKLKKLILKNFIIDDNDADTLETICDTLEVLNMGMISMCYWPSFMHYLNHFENLRELCINVSDYNTTLNVQTVDILAHKCKKLQKLSLEKCDLSVEDFGVLTSLKHLSLDSCGGLTFANFQQILGALTLKSFTMINTRIIGNINHIFVSPTLERISINTIRFTQISEAFQKSLNNFESLHTLEWLNGDINDNWIIDKCPKLKYLHIPNPYLLRRIVFTMKSLKELTFTSCTGLSWCFILILIRNLKLERLCLQTNELIDDDREIPLNACGIKTTLRMITIPCNIFKMAQSFWLDLMYLNVDLHYLIYGKHEELLDGIFLDEMICSERFCRRVKWIKICGYKLVYRDSIIEKKVQVDEQLKLVSVCKRFEYFLTKQLWPKMYANINLYLRQDIHIITIITNKENRHEMDVDLVEARKTKMVLYPKELIHFLHLQAKHVKALKLHSEYQQPDICLSFENMRIFSNLTELTYHQLCVDDEQLRVLARKCKNLQKLHLLECYCTNHSPLIPGVHLNLNILNDMQQLEELVIRAETQANIVIRSLDLQVILLNIKLKKLILQNISLYGNAADNLENLTNSLEVFDVGIITSQFWLSFHYYLNHFDKLKELTINVSDYRTILNIQIIHILATKCVQLEKLCLEKCDLCVDDFAVLKNLKHLSLNSCGGLTFANFQQLLGGLKLQTFSFIKTRILGEITHIYASPTLEEITIDSINYAEISKALNKSLNKFENLHSLIWLNGSITDRWLIDKCPKLQYLHIPSPLSLKPIISQLKSLKELSFNSCNGVSWAFILFMISVIQLECLYLRTNETISDNTVIPVNACGIKTSLRMILIPCKLFRKAQPFWIDLLCLNDQLHYSIYGKHEELLDDEFLNELLLCEKFCLRVKWIEICGFKLDCMDLQDNFDRAIQEVNKFTSHYRFKNSNFTMEM